MHSLKYFVAIIALYLDMICGLYGEQYSSKTFSIAGIFPRVSSAPALAATMAIEDINKLASSTGRNAFTNITMTAGETNCHSQQAAALMYKIMSTGLPKPVIIAGCPEDCEMISRASPVFNAITICYGISQIPYYGSKAHLPSLFLAQPHLFSIIPALDKFIRHFGWKRVAVLHQDYEDYIDIAHQLTFVLGHHDTEVLRIETSLDDPTHSLDLIEREDVRIILSLASESFSRELLCQIYHRGLFGSDKYVWFFIGSHHKEWFLQSHSPLEEEDVSDLSDEVEDHDVGNKRQVDCTADQLIQAADGHFTTKAALWNVNDQIKTVSGMTVADFRRRLLKKLKDSGEHVNSDFDESPLAYDSVWAAYLALNKTAAFGCSDGKAPCEFAYDNYGFETQQAMTKDLKFHGVSGKVSFNEEGERSITNACIKIERYKNRQKNTVAWHYNSNNTFTWIEDPFGKNIPKDSGLSFPTTIPPESATQKCNSANELVVSKYNLISLLSILYSIILSKYRIDYALL